MTLANEPESSTHESVPDGLAAAETALLATTGIQVERRDTVVDGLRLHYLMCGEGEPLLLLHGRGRASAHFTPVLAPLAARRRVLALDLPGWGLSAKPPFTGHTPQDALDVWVDGVRRFLDDQGIDQIDLLGHSMGGLTALGFALAYPDRVGRLIAVDSAGLGSRMQLDARLYFGLGPERLHRLFGPRFTRFINHQGGGIRRDANDAAVLAFTHAVATQEEVIPSGASAFDRWVSLGGVHVTLLDRLKELEMPVLLLWGDRDTVTPYANALVAVRYLRDGQLVAFTGCGHTPFAERPDDFAHVVLTWLAGIYVPSRA